MRRRRHDRRKEEDLKDWIPALIVFAVVFLVVFIGRLFSNCIFEWPIRWDFGTCWNEQIESAKQKAAESAAEFAP